MSKETDKLNARINELEIQVKLMKESLADRPAPVRIPVPYPNPLQIGPCYELPAYKPFEITSGQKYTYGHDSSTSVNLGDAPACGQNLDDLGTKPVFTNPQAQAELDLAAQQARTNRYSSAISMGGQHSLIGGLAGGPADPNSRADIGEITSSAQASAFRERCKPLVC